MNNRLKLDTTMLQSNTAMHLIAYIISQRDIIIKYINNEEPTNSELKEIAEDCEYILTKHTEALHKRCGTRIYGSKKEDPYDNSQPYKGVSTD